MTITFLRNIIKIVARKTGIISSFSAQRILEKNFPENSSFVFVQVGALDGSSHDFLFDFVKKRNAAGIVIEPLPDFFAELVQHYAFNPAIVPVNKAVHASAKEIILYRVKKEKLKDLPSWAAGISSIDPEHYKRSGQIPASAMKEEKVAADHFMHIIKANDPKKRINYLQIDTEGYDLEVLKQIDFTLIRPDMIRFEYSNLGSNDREYAIHLLKAKNYYCFYEDMDITAVQLSSIRL